ncbi:uncharacterized protein [Rutidosis leptorrhynchoides]|uniref:uncharacterized protein n=1 Tax=Rutidosis leptorrhynchoides TaxID=125765 RepID=UPI003A9A3A88
MTDELYNGQIYSKIASDVWKKLKETYDKIEGSVIFNLYQKLNSITHGGSSVSDYYQNLNSLWKQYDTMVQLPSCDLTSSKSFKDHTSLIKLIQFLMGLDDIYQPIRSNIVTRDPLPSVNTAFSIISREESHTKSNISNKKNTESSAFYTNSYKPNANQQFKELKCTKCGRTNHTIDKCFEVVGYPTRSGNLKCTKCGMTNHTVDKCFEVVGYSNNLRKKGFGSNNNFKCNTSKANNDTTGSSSSTPISLSNEQIMRLLSLLDDKGAVKPGVSNMAGNFENYNVFFNSQFDIFYKNNMISDNVENMHYGWIIDSGANQHMTNSINNFVSHNDVSDLNLTVSHPNGTKAKVSKIGNLRISNDIILKDVLVVPDYHVSLLSVHCLVRDNNLFVGFDNVACYIQDLVSKKTLVSGGLYFLTGNEKGIVGSSNITKVDKYSVDLWHCRLGHPAEQALMCLKHSLNLNKQSFNEPCDICHKAKQTRESFVNSNHKTTELGELVHLDVWGPYKNQFKRTVKCFRSDNGTEFVNSKVNDFMLSNGIVHQTSCAYTPQQNGPDDEGEDNEHQSEGSSETIPGDDTNDSSSADELDVNARSSSPTTTLNDDNTNPEGTNLQNQDSSYSFQHSVRRSQRNTSLP